MGINYRYKYPLFDQPNVSTSYQKDDYKFDPTASAFSFINKYDVLDDFLVDETAEEYKGFTFLEDIFEEKEDDDMFSMFKKRISGYKVDDTFVQRPYKKDKPWNRKTNFLLQSLKSLLDIDICINRQLVVIKNENHYLDFPKYMLNLKHLLKKRQNTPTWYHCLFELLCKTFILYKNPYKTYKYIFYGDTFVCTETKTYKKFNDDLINKLQKAKNVNGYKIDNGLLLVDFKIDLKIFLKNIKKEYGCEYLIFIKEKYDDSEVINDELDENLLDI